MKANNHLASLVSVLSRLISIQVLAAILLDCRFEGRHSAEHFCRVPQNFCGLFYDVIVHLTLDGPFVNMSLFRTVRTSEGRLAELYESLPLHVSLSIWREDSKARCRRLDSDPTVISVEILTIKVDSLLAVLLIPAVLNLTYYM
ncbi:LOW QUALITY PROTEIN: emopamil-binding protein-like [Aulostomus maculatus]